MLQNNSRLFKSTRLGEPYNNTKLNTANKIPIESMYAGTLKKMGKVLMGKCPFHEENTPSFAIYPETNTWNCFATWGGGDAVSFYMKLHKVDFRTAVEVLTE